MFNVSVNDKKNIYRSKPVMNVDTVPKPLTYDYMPEGYPSKSVGTVTLMEEQEVTFTNSDGIYQAIAPVKIDISDGQTYTIVWDGVEYSCVCHARGPITYMGNPKVEGLESTGEPFLYENVDSQSVWVSYDTATSHTIKVMRQQVTITPMSVDFMPKNLNVVFKKESGSTQVNCNVTYNELRDWVERDVPVFAVFIDATSSQYYRYNIGGIALLTDMLRFAYYVGNRIDKSFAYKSDGTIEIQQS